MGRRIILMTALVLGLVNPLVAADVDPNLVGWWTLDGDALDSSGHGRNGTLQGNAQFDVGLFGQALVLAGSPDCVTIDGYKGVLATGGVAHAFTVACWIKTAANGEMITWGKNTGGQRLSFRVDTVLRVENGTANVRGTNGSDLRNNEWHHVAATVPHGGAIKDVILYVDGVNVTPAGTSTSALNLTADTDVSLGRSAPLATDTARYFKGLIDDACIYDRALTAEEIAVLARRPVSWAPTPAEGAVIEAASATLGWTSGRFAAQQVVYVGTSPELGVADLAATQAETMFAVTNLGQDQTYYWRVDGLAADGTVHAGPVWSFYVPPMRAYRPQPEDAIVNVLTNAKLSWTGGWSPIMHTVYFGADKDQVAAAAGGLPQMEVTYDPGPLALDTTYYWRVDEFYAGQWVAGPVWSFKTLGLVPPVEDPNLVAWYTLDEGAGRTAIDWSGHNGHGTFTGDVPWAAGIVGGALSFNGISGNYVEAPDAPNVTGTHSRTVTAWIKTTTYGEIASWGQNVAGQKWIFRVQETDGTLGAIRVEVNGGYQVGSTDVRDDNWHHVAAVLVNDGTPDANEIALYVDGLLEVSSARLDEPINTPAGVVRIGQSPWGVRPFSGLIDDVRIYDKALTAEEIGKTFSAVPVPASVIAVGPADSVVATGDDGTIVSINGVDAAGLVLGVTVTDFEKYADHPAPHADDFDLKTYASLDESKFITTTFAVPVRTIFVLERGANDSGFFQLLNAAGAPVDAAQPFATSDWSKPGVKVNGQAAGALVITSSVSVRGISFLPPAGAVMGLDPACIAAVPVR
jgi:hypothetical protein